MPVIIIIIITDLPNDQSANILFSFSYVCLQFKLSGMSGQQQFTPNISLKYQRIV